MRSMTGVTYDRIVPGRIWIGEADGEQTLVEADTVVIAAGQEPNDPLSAALRRADVPRCTLLKVMAGEPAVNEEVFGPVLSIPPPANADELVAVAN